MTGGTEISSGHQQYDRIQMLKSFDETKAGVKGLLDSGVLKIPEIFIRPRDELDQELTRKRAQIQVPKIDLSDIRKPERRKEIVEEIRVASETWGFFQVTNHGIPLPVLEGMINGVKEFNEQDVEEKKKYYSRDYSRKVKFHSNHDLFTSRTANWRDSLSITVPDPDQIDKKELPKSCRESTVQYSKKVVVLGNTLLVLLSESLGLKPDHLRNMECSNGHRITSHYYPACPQPELTIGTTMHSDPGFLTILLQNQVSGLQVSYEDQWVDIEPVSGGLVVNIGDLLQLVSNGMFKSNQHRVMANSIGPRISVACFFSGPHSGKNKIYGPIKDLISEENPPVYKEVLLSDYVLNFLNNGLEKNLGPDRYRL